MSPSGISLGNFATGSSTNHCPITFPGYFPPKSDSLVIAICIINILSSFSAATWNFMVLWAIKSTPSLHTSSSVLLFGLALADFVTGVLVQPMVAIHLIGSLTMHSPIYCITGAIAYTLATSLTFVSFSAITVISFDRYLALALHLRYAAIVTVNRVIKLILLAFVILFPTSIYFWFSNVEWFKKVVLVPWFSLRYGWHHSNPILLRSNLHNITTTPKANKGSKQHGDKNTYGYFQVQEVCLYNPLRALYTSSQLSTMWNKSCDRIAFRDRGQRIFALSWRNDGAIKLFN